jgi:ABC-type lipoprotein export system ATPase subunit/histidinol phosphatase-like PHP family hydrolase
MRKTQGLFFKKFDLHIHTPASKCFYDKNVTPEQIVQKAIQMKLNAIAITDHNTGEWVDKIKIAANKTNLTIFPGVEITVGDAHNHIIALLDIDKTTRDIEDLLTTVGILHNEFGKTESFSKKSVTKVIEVITGEKFEGIAVPAHIDSTNGVFEQMKGMPRKEVIQHPKLLAVEAVNFQKVFKFLNGNDPLYERKLAVYQSSDNPYIDRNGNIIITGSYAGKHSIYGIGYRYSYFKVDKNISLESLRQCFIDPEVRIRQSFEYKKRTYPHIKSVKINSGFLSDIESNFHQGLNSILGAKGVGKSLLIEFIRFALDQESTHNEINEDHKEKLKKQLGQYGRVEINICDETGKEFEIIRTYNPAEDNPLECKDVSTNEILNVNIAQLFPVLFLSQTEIIKIAEDSNEQMMFIDKFFDFYRYRNQISGLESELKELDREFADSLKAFHEQKDFHKQLKTSKIELERLSKQLKNPIFDGFTKLEEKDKIFRIQYNFLKILIEHINNFERVIKNEEISEMPKVISLDPALKRTQDTVKNTKSFLLENFVTQREKVNKAIKNIFDEYKNWKPTFDEKKSKFQEQVLRMGGDSQKLEEKRTVKVKEIENIEKKLLSIRNKANQIKEISKIRNEKLKELKKIYHDYFQARKEKCEYFEKVSKNKLQITIIESTNKDEFQRCLAFLKRGSYLREWDIEQLSNKVTPYEFILNLLRYDISRTDELGNANKHIKEIAQITNLAEEKVKNLADHLLNSKSYEELLLLQYKAIPQDRPEIKYNIGDSQKPNFVNLNNLSTGQKCAAMIILALSEGIMPIIIDQPEDSLDIRAIWDDMCSKLRSKKEVRQFIFTTHNASIAVASDTDKFIIMTASATLGEIAFSGAIDNEYVRSEVIKYLEGGLTTYKLKYLKYNIPKKLKK